MVRTDTTYHVGRHTGRCHATGRVLEPGTPCMAALCDAPHDAPPTVPFVRYDFSMDAWAGGERPPGLFSHWKTLAPNPDQKRSILVDDTVLQDVFERLADDANSDRVAFRFVLALILMRKRLLKYIGRDAASAAGGADTWLFRPRGSEPEAPPIRVVDPCLSDDALRDLSDQLGEILHADL